MLLGRGKWFPALVRERTGVEVRMLGVQGVWQRMLLVRPSQAGDQDRRVRAAAAMVIQHMARCGRCLQCKNLCNPPLQVRLPV